MQIVTRIGTDDSFSLSFKKPDGTYFDLTPFTRFVLSFGGVQVDSAISSTVFSASGETLTIYLGRSNITSVTIGFMQLIGYSPTYDDGIILIDRYSDSPVYLTLADPTSDSAPVGTGTKTTLAEEDTFYIRDSEDGNNIKLITWADLLAAIEAELI